MEKLLLCFPALNQLYFTTSSLITYERLFNNFIEALLKKINLYTQANYLEEIQKHINQIFMSDEIEIRAFIQNESLLYNKLNAVLRQYSSECEINEDFFNDITLYDSPSILYFVEDYLKEFISKGVSLIINNNQFYKIFLDRKILKLLNLENYFSFYLDHDLLLFSKINPSKTLVFSDDANNLLPFYKLNCHVGLLCNIILSGLEFDNEYMGIIKKNEELILGKSIKISFFATTFFQQKYLIEEFLNNSIISLDEFFSKHLKVVTLLKTNFKYDLFKRNRFIMSNKKCIFQPYFGGKDLEIYGNFNVIINRFNMTSDFKNYENILSIISQIRQKDNSITVIDSLNNLDCFLERDKMMRFLLAFHDLKEVKNMALSEFKINLNFPETVIVPIEDVICKEYLPNLISQNTIKLPFLIKFKHNCKKLSHTMILVINSKGFDELVLRLEEIQKAKGDVVCVIQNFINHGGYIAKLYRYNNQVLINYRPSIPDVNSEDIETVEEFKKGFWEYMTDQMGSSEYKVFWNKFKNNKSVCELADKTLMQRISEHFEAFSEKTLFGLDFIYNSNDNSYGLIDCNYFPGYKEIEKDFGEYLTEHILYYYSKNK